LSWACSHLHRHLQHQPTDATAILVLDRAISVFSIWIFGGIVYVLSDKTKANRKPIEASAPST
jgi:uncharacterized membrane protein YbhN (UPF0104 family)